jgi:membrane fusion protein, copper/silver efflux system
VTNQTSPPPSPRRIPVALVIVLLVVAAAGVYAGVRWHSSIASAFGAKAADNKGPSEASNTTGNKRLWTCGMHPQVIQDHPGDCPICHMKLTPLAVDKPAPSGSSMGDGSAATPVQTRANGGAGKERKIKYWWDPMMSPPYMSDKPGKSPMGMDLVAVYEDEAQPSTGQVVIDPAVVQNMGVRTALVTEGPLERSVRVVGYLDEAETNVRDINLRVSGWVRRLYANTEGMRVEVGDPLFDLYSPELQVAIEELISSRRAQSAMPASETGGAPSTAAAIMEAATRKLVLLGLDPRQVETLAKLDKAPESVTFTSPISGLITEKPIVEGAAVQVGERVLRIVDQSVLWLEGQLFEKDLPFVQVGQHATAKIAGGTGEAVAADVIFIRPRIDAMTRTAAVRLAIPNPTLGLRPGMYAIVNWQSRVADRVVLVPREAVIDTGERQIVILSRSGGHFEPRAITMGAGADGGMVQIVKGLAPGETVVTSGQFLLDSESRLREAIQKFLSEKTQAADPIPTSTVAPAPASSAPAAPSRAMPPAAAQEVDAVFVAYLDLSEKPGAEQSKDTHIDPAGLVAAAAALHSALGDAKEAPLAVEVAKAAESMKGHPIDHQREAFKSLSEKVIALADALPPTTSVADRLFLIHCPMAPGDWLQKTEGVANPYYANEMKRCGEVVRTIPKQETR